MKMNYEKPQVQVLKYQCSAVETVTVSGGTGSGPIELPDLYSIDNDNVFAEK